MSGRISFASLVLCFIAGVCTLFFCAAHAGTRSTISPRKSAPPKSSPEAAKFYEDAMSKVADQIKDLQASNGHVAWVIEKPSTNLVYRDGEPLGSKYDGVKYLEFSPDGNHLAFFGERDSKWIVVVDGQEHPAGYADVTPLAFQPHGTSWAFGGCQADSMCQMVENGDTVSRIYEHVSPPQYSPDGKRLAYLGESNEKWTAIVDGKEIGPAVNSYSCLGFSPDATHFYYCGRKTMHGWTYVIDGVPGPFFVQLSPISFTDDGKHTVYGGSSFEAGFKRNEATGAIVLDGKIGPKFVGLGTAGEWTLLVQVPLIAAEPYTAGAIAPLFYFRLGQFISGPQVLSARLNGVSDPILDGDGNAVYAAQRGPDDVSVIDGTKSGPRFDDVMSGVVFSKDRLHSAYVALRGKELVEVLDNQPTKSVALDSQAIIGVRKPVLDAQGIPVPGTPDPIDLKAFSVDWAALTPNANHFAYEIVDGKLRFKAGRTSRAHRIVILDGQPGTRYNALGISTIHFSEDEKHYWYTVYGADGKRGLLVVDGEESKLYENITEAELDKAANDIVFFGRSGNRLQRITFPLN